jgi:[ribosomal protein S5]-alanine N-acetyltransferase
MKKVFENLPVIETERLILRPVEEGDFKAMFEYARDPDVAKFTTWEAHKNIEDSKTHVRFILKRYKGNKPSNWAVILKPENKDSRPETRDSRLIGTCGFVSEFKANNRAEIGFAIRKDCWNKGYVTEALKKTLEFGFKTIGYNRIEAICDVENIASARVLEKCGMKFEGILRQYIMKRGEFRDVRSYAILAEDYNLTNNQ